MLLRCDETDEPLNRPAGVARRLRALLLLPALLWIAVVPATLLAQAAAPTPKELAQQLMPTGKGGVFDEKQLPKLKQTLEALRAAYLESEKLCAVQKDPSADACKKAREDEQWLIKGTYGYLQRVAGVDPLFERHREDARKALMIAAVGMPDNMSHVFQRMRDRNLSEQDAKNLYRIQEWLADPKFLELVEKRAKESGAVAAPLDRMVQESKNDPASGLGVLLDLEYVDMRASVRALDEIAGQYRAQMNEDTADSLLIVVEEPPASGKPMALDFVESLMAILTAWSAEGIYEPVWAPHGKLEDKIQSQLSSCEKQKSCDAVLAIGTDVVASGELEISGRFRFVRDKNHRDTPAKVSIPLGNTAKSPCADPDLGFRAAVAVKDFMRQLRSKASILGNIEALERFRDTVRFSKPVACGIGITDGSSVPKDKLPSALRGKVRLRKEGACGEAFDKALVTALKEYDQVVTLIDDTSEELPRLVLSTENQLECHGKVMVGKDEAYHVDTTFQQADQAEEAGSSTAAFVGEFFRGLNGFLLTTAAPPEPEKKKKPDVVPQPTRVGPYHRFQGVLLSGLPWLTDGVSKPGDKWALGAAVTDGVLTVGGAFSLFWSTKLRNDYAEAKPAERGTLGPASTFRTIGLISLAIVAAGRAATVLAFTRPEAEPESTGASVKSAALPSPIPEPAPDVVFGFVF